MASAFLDWMSLCTRDPFGSYGKLASIWFDRVICHVPADDVVLGVIRTAVGEGSLSAAVGQRLGNFWFPIQAVLPGYSFLQKAWDCEDKRLIEVAERITLEATLRDTPGADTSDPGFAHEVGWSTAGLIDTIATWGALIATGGCALLGGDRERRAAEELLGFAEPPGAFSLFSEVAELRIPNLAGLTWDRVIELREHPFLAQFRKKLHGIADEMRTGNRAGAVEVLEEVRRKDTEDMLRLCRPDPGASIVKAIATNLPLPLPVNPASLGVAVDEVIESFKRRERFGWLYFLLDLG